MNKKDEEKLRKLTNEYRRCYKNNDEKGKNEIYKELKKILGTGVNAYLIEFMVLDSQAEKLRNFTKKELEKIKEKESKK